MLTLMLIKIEWTTAVLKYNCYVIKLVGLKKFTAAKLHDGMVLGDFVWYSLTSKGSSVKGFL